MQKRHCEMSEVLALLIQWLVMLVSVTMLTQVRIPFVAELYFSVLIY